MTNQELATTFKQIRNERRGGAPHDVWVKRNRDILLMQVRNTTDAAAKPGLAEYARHLFSIFFPAEGFAMAARALGVFALVIGTVLGGGLVSAQMYGDAVPGEVMYRMKLAVESAQLFLAPNDEYKTRLHAEFADHRIDEVAALAEGTDANHDHVPGVLTSFDAEIVALANGLESIKANDPDGVVVVAKTLERKMAVYQNRLRKAATTVSPQLQARIAVSRDLADGVTIKAIAIIVEKHLAGSADAPRAVVVSKVEERLKQAEAKVAAEPETQDAARTERTAKAKAAVAAAKELLKEDQYQAALAKIAEVAELTKEEEPAPAPAPVTPPADETTPAPDTSTKEEGTPTSADAPPQPAP